MTSMRHHYTQAQLVDAIRRTGIAPGDTVSLQVSLGRLGLPEGAATTGAIANLVIDAFLQALGERGTLIVPTYSYSIGRGEVFEVESTPSGIGDFTEIFRTRPGAIRSRDPMLSSAGIGPNAQRVLRTISNSCYGAGSTYDRLKEIGAWICTLGVSLYWATFRHHIEEMAGVPFRFRKRFTGAVREGGQTRQESWIYFAAPYAENCEPVGLPLEQKARAAGLVAVETVGRGELMAIRARDFFDFGVAQLREEPWLTAKGPACSVEELVKIEDARVGAVSLETSLPANASIGEIIAGLAGLPRDPLSAGSDAALEALARQYPMQMHAYPSGTQAGEDIVPEKWTCRDASVRTAQGEPVFSLRDHVNHVAACSWPFQAELTCAELLEHLYVGEAQVPFVSMRGTRRWALCCTAAQAAALAEERYTVSIEAAFSFGLCRVGEAVLAGRSAQSILLLARYDRRNDAHGGMAAAALGIAALRALQARGIPDCTVRLLLVSDRAARDAWLAAHSQAPAFTVAVVDLDRVAADGSIALAGPAVLDAPDVAVSVPAAGRIAPAPVLPVKALEQAAAQVADALLQARS